MSYILDALKRAESERSRGEIPGLNAQPMGLTSADAGAPASPLRVAAVAAGIVLILGAAVWWWSGGASAPLTNEAMPPAAALPIPAPLAGAPAAVPPPVWAPVPQVSSAPPAVVVEAVRPAAAPVARAQLRVPPRSPSGAVANSTSRSKPPAARLDPPPFSASGGPPAPDADTRVYAMNELPVDIRGALPALVVGGASHSEHAASRMLILNGQIYHEGDRLTAELTLQQIQLRSAVLSFRGYRFGISY